MIAGEFRGRADIDPQGIAFGGEAFGLDQADFAFLLGDRRAAAGKKHFGLRMQEIGESPEDPPEDTKDDQLVEYA